MQVNISVSIIVFAVTLRPHSQNGESCRSSGILHAARTPACLILHLSGQAVILFHNTRRSSSIMGDTEEPISPLSTETMPKTTPRSPYVEDETDEEFRPDTPPSDVARDERICRICFSGPEEVDSQGKLISPCKCR